LGSDDIDSLDASETIIKGNSFALTQLGTYYVGACVDSVTDESNTTNQCSTGIKVVVIKDKPSGGAMGYLLPLFGLLMMLFRRKEL
jgi:hypothetical protein